MKKFTYWKKLSQDEISTRVFNALSQNINYENEHILGIPASYLDEKVFNQDATFLGDAPYISTLVQNPNHIGCHTLGHSEPFFKGTQKIEVDALDICAVDILNADPNSYDGYIAAGGTEANMQAIWIYRNYYQQAFGATNDEIAILCTADSHYSMHKAANVFMVDVLSIPVRENDRMITSENIEQTVKDGISKGKKYFIVVCTMMTTMFGSVDDVHAVTSVLDEMQIQYKLHVDGAYGGFYFPFTQGDDDLTFANPKVNSITLDAHKMAQAPYGTGIFIIRKDWIHRVNTAEASYVEGQDFTLIGSRSGANAIAVWMILTKNGPFGWQEKVYILQKRTSWLCSELDDLGISYYRHPRSNIVTIKASFIPQEIAKKYGLVPDNHTEPSWFKIVIMEHVTIEKLMLLIEDIKNTNG